MKFGTKVLVARGSPDRPRYARGCLRFVPGVLIGAHLKRYKVRLSADDPFDSVGWNRAGCVGWWDITSVKPLELHNY